MAIAGSNTDPTGSASPLRVLLRIAFGLLVGGVGACFTGAGADGLPCDSDDDCGIGQSCDQGTGCCGGACADSFTTTESTSSTTTDSTSTTSTSTTIDPTTSSTTIDPSETVGSTGREPFCGDAEVLEGEEECDLGEAMNENPFSGCTPECREALLLYSPKTGGLDDIPDPNPLAGMAFSEATLMETTDTWSRNMMTGRWSSGTRPPAPPVSTQNDLLHGANVLQSKEFLLDVPPDYEAWLYLEHSLAFDVCSPTQRFDGARVLMRPAAAGPYTQVGPHPMLGGTEANVGPINMDPGACESSPFADGDNAFFGNSSGAATGGPFQIPRPMMPQMVVVEFHASYNCNDCEAPLNRSDWEIDQVAIVVRPTGALP